jgi:hypothetical protein
MNRNPIGKGAINKNEIGPKGTKNTWQKHPAIKKIADFEKKDYWLVSYLISEVFDDDNVIMIMIMIMIMINDNDNDNDIDNDIW